MIVRSRSAGDEEWLTAALVERWGSTVIVTRGRETDAAGIDALIALDASGERTGLLTYRIGDDGLEVVTLDSMRPGLGVGSALLGRATEVARRAGAQRLWLITTNDNLHAIGFYERRGLAGRGCSQGRRRRGETAQAIDPGSLRYRYRAPRRDRARAGCGQSRRDSNAVGTSFTVVRHLVGQIERPEDRVLPGFVNPLPSRRAASRRVASRVLGIGGLVLAVLAVPAVSGAATASHRATGAQAGKPAVFSILPSGASLFDGQSLVSPNGRFKLAMQSDGNLVLYGDGLVLWDSGTLNDAPDSAMMQGDGNFVIYKANRPIWSSGTSSAVRGSYRLAVQSDGNVVVYSPANKPLWQTFATAGAGLQYGDSGPAVRTLQAHLMTLGYWLGTANGYFGDSTQQAVWALQKAAGLPRTGTITGATAVADRERGPPQAEAHGGQSRRGQLEQRPCHDHPGRQARLDPQHLDGRRLHLLGQVRDLGRHHAHGHLPHLLYDQRAGRRLARRPVAPEVLHLGRHRHSRRLLRPAGARLPRLCACEQRGDQLDLGEQHPAHRRGGLGLLR